MTNEVQSFQFTPTALEGAGGAGFDFFQSNAAYRAPRERPGQNTLQYFRISQNVLRGELTIRDLSGGINMQVVEVSEGAVPNGLATSTSETRFSRTHAIRPLESEEATDIFGGGSGLTAFHVAYLPEERLDVIVGAGSTANEALWTVAQSGNSLAWTAQTYSPGSAITSLSTAVIGGVTQPERLIVGRAGAAAQVLTDIDGTPTTSGTMHANTAELYGVIVTPLNAATPGASTLLLYAANTIYSLSSAAALTAAPTAVLTNIPAGGSALGFFALLGGPPRAYWLIPYEDDGTSFFRILSTNAEGDDPQYLSVPHLGRIIDAKYWENRGGLVVTDGKQLVWLTGESVNQTSWHSSRVRSSDWEYISGIELIEDRCLVVVNTITGQVNDIVSGTVLEEWIPETGVWHRAGVVTHPANSSFPSVARSIRLSPVFQNWNVITSGGFFLYYFHREGQSVAATPFWRWINILPASLNPFYAQVAGPGTRNLTYNFATSSFVVLARMHLIGLEGLPKVAADCWFGGEFPASTAGTTGTVTIQVAMQDATAMRFNGETTTGGATAAVPTFTFHEGDRWEHHIAKLSTNTDSFDRLQIMETLTRPAGSNDEATSPNGLPFKLGFYVFLDGKVRSPQEADPERFK